MYKATVGIVHPHNAQILLLPALLSLSLINSCSPHLWVLSILAQPVKHGLAA
jgi:hypothetical protein